MKFNDFSILCPNCERGIIHEYATSVNDFEYDDGSTRMGITLHMKCPYCGDSVLCCDDGRKLTYNYLSNKCKFTKVVFVSP